MGMYINAYGKITLELKVIGRRKNGYHELEQIMAPILLCDLLEISKTERNISFYCDVPGLMSENNLCYKAAQMLKDEFNISSGININLYKRIPPKAGLGGGSADCAAVLRAINYLYNLKLSTSEMSQIGIQLGADVPYCLYSELSCVSGIGEHITTINHRLNYDVLIVKPDRGISTQQSFNLLDEECSETFSRHAYDGWVYGQEFGLENLIWINDLEKPAIRLVKEIGLIKCELKEIGFEYVLMSGSGSCVFGISNNKQLIKRGVRIMKRKYPFVCITRVVERVSDFDKKYEELLQYERKI